MKNEVIMTI